jgi:acetoacetyl-CoA reductase
VVAASADRPAGVVAASADRPADGGHAPDGRLKALVTGAARPGGIGAAIAARLDAAGLAVVTLDVEPGCTYQVDLADGELPPLEDIDVLVSNAGLPTVFGGAHSMDLERWRRDLAVNLTGSFRVVQASLRGMRERRFGRIIVISSFAATYGMPAQVAYSASKAGLVGMIKTVAVENAALGITANAILPGLVASAGVTSMPPEIIEAWLERIPSGRMVDTAEIAEAAAYFASPAAGSVTGQELIIDGGLTLNSLSVTRSVVRRRDRDPPVPPGM